MQKMLGSLRQDFEKILKLPPLVRETLFNSRMSKLLDSQDDGPDKVVDLRNYPSFIVDFAELFPHYRDLYKNRDEYSKDFRVALDCLEKLGINWLIEHAVRSAYVAIYPDSESCYLWEKLESEQKAAMDIISQNNDAMVEFQSMFEHCCYDTDQHLQRILLLNSEDINTCNYLFGEWIGPTTAIIHYKPQM